MPALITLQKFLSGGDWEAIKKYKLTGILPSYVARPKPKKNKKYSGPIAKKKLKKKVGKKSPSKKLTKPIVTKKRPIYRRKITY